MKSYADTSFLVPLYTPDIHSMAASAVMARIHQPVFITSFGEIELCNATKSQVFRKTLTAPSSQNAIRAFKKDIRAGLFMVQPFFLAKRLSLKHTPTLGIRRLDLMHLASALTLEATLFLSFDNNQRNLAHAVGLTLQPKTL